MRKTIAIIVAAGSSSRMRNVSNKTCKDKLFAEINGKLVLLYSLEAFQAADSVDEIIVVCSDNSQIFRRVRRLCENIPKVIDIVPGGSVRAQSVRNGLNAIKYTDGIVAIHDGARPLVTPKLIDEVVAVAREFRAAIPAVAVKDTVKIMQYGFVESTPDRSSLYAAQTPQVFDLKLYREAGATLDVTDDSMLVEKMGVKVRIVDGDERNIKITTPEDLKIAGVLLNGIN